MASIAGLFRVHRHRLPCLLAQQSDQQSLRVGCDGSDLEPASVPVICVLHLKLRSRAQLPLGAWTQSLSPFPSCLVRLDKNLSLRWSWRQNADFPLPVSLGL